MAQGPDEDLALVNAARAGEEDAFKALFEKYRDRAVALAYRYTHNREDALDVVQDAFLKVFRSLSGFKGQSRFVHWLFRIVVNRAIDVCRSREASHPTYDEAREGEGIAAPDLRPDANPLRSAARNELQEAYQNAIGELSPEHRAVISLHVSQGMRYIEIAETLDIPVGTVMSRLHYARKHLQEILKKFLDADRA